MHSSVICKPEMFSMNQREFFAFHMGLDEAMCLSGVNESCEESFWAKKAFEAWSSASS
jgi:hypothetical protein